MILSLELTGIARKQAWLAFGLSLVLCAGRVGAGEAPTLSLVAGEQGWAVEWVRIDGHPYLALTPLLRALSVKHDFLPELAQARLLGAGGRLTLQEGFSVALLGEVPLFLPKPVRILNGDVWVPIELLAQALPCVVGKGARPGSCGEDAHPRLALRPWNGTPEDVGLSRSLCDAELSRALDCADASPACRSGERCVFVSWSRKPLKGGAFEVYATEPRSALAGFLADALGRALGSGTRGARLVPAMRAAAPGAVWIEFSRDALELDRVSLGLKLAVQQWLAREAAP